MDPLRRLLRLAVRQHGLATRAQAIAVGLSRHQVDHLIAQGRLEVVCRGVYRIGGCPRTFEQELTAAILAAGPGAVASHRAAARLWGLPIGEPVVEVSVPSTSRPRLYGVELHRTVLPLDDVTRVQGVKVTKPLRTIVDLAAVLDDKSLEDAVDEAAARRIVSLPAIDGYLRDLGTKGRCGAGRLQSLVADRIGLPRLPQSRLERDALRFLRRYGLPDPVVQHRVPLPGGRHAYLDIAWPRACLALECDSFRYHSAMGAWARDRTRNNALVALGWRIISVTWEDLKSRPGPLAAEIAGGLDTLPARVG